MSKAVIYCRVSTGCQKKLGDGLASQATRCHEFARYKGLSVVKVYEDSQSGALIQRPAMQEMLKFLRRHRRDGITVIIDDISRLARGLETHLQLRQAINKAGTSLITPSIEFGEDSDSTLVENMLASVSQHHRQKNAEQTHNRMRGRMVNGYWVHFAPRGYRYEKAQAGGKILVHDEPLASTIQEGLEGYASGRFQLKAEVKHFWESSGIFPKNRKGTITNEEVNRILKRVVYAGYIESDIMKVALRPAQHEPLISLETYRRIQERMQEQCMVPARKDLAVDFPLRGTCLCDSYGRPLTACWSKGRNRHYAYYYCFNSACKQHRKNIKRDVLEGQFEALVRNMKPSTPLFAITGKMFKT